MARIARYRVLLVLIVLIAAALYISGNPSNDGNGGNRGGGRSGGGEVDTPSAYVERYGGSADVYQRIQSESDCATFQAEFDQAAENNDRAEAGTNEHRWTTGYMTAADARMRSLGCYE